MPAITPASIPRINRFLTIFLLRASVTGEAEEMTAVMNEFMDVHPRDDGGGAFLGAHEVESQQEKDAEDQPGRDLANGNGEWR
jgi:hypothetical protein